MAQADSIVRSIDGRRLSIEMELTEDGLHKARAVLSDGTTVCEAVSKSWRYARRKVAKLALDLLVMPSRKFFLSNPEYQARILERKEKEKAKCKAEARARDAKRRKSQAEAKKRRAENAARAAAKAAKEARPMSARKRRFLEDKKK